MDALFSGALSFEGRDIYDARTRWYIKRVLTYMRRQADIQWAVKSLDHALSRIPLAPFVKNQKAQSSIYELCDKRQAALEDLLYPGLRKAINLSKKEQALAWKKEYESVFGELDTPEGQAMIARTLELLRAPPQPSVETQRLEELRRRLETKRTEAKNRLGHMRRMRSNLEM